MSALLIKIRLKILSSLKNASVEKLLIEGLIKGFLKYLL